MKKFAKVEDGIVTQVFEAEPEFFNTFVDTSPGEWIETGQNIRKNYAGIGFSYDKTRDAFIEPKYHDSWTLDESTCRWEAPVPYPSDDKHYNWDEKTKSWVKIS